MTLERVLDAAVTIADRDGPAALSMDSVAAEAGMPFSSLQAHVDCYKGLRRHLRAHSDQLLSASLVAAAREHPGRPQEALRSMGLAYRAFAVAHPGLYAVLFPSVHGQEEPGAAGVAAEPVELGASLLGQLGVPHDRRLHIVRSYAAILHGHVLQELMGGGGSGDADLFDAALDRFLGSISHATGR